jgi:hypothetical protein
MNEYKDFSSLPPETEREFVVYEKTSVEAGKKAKVIALGVAFGFLAIVMVIVFSFPKPHNLMAEDDMSGLAAPTDKDGKEAKKAEGEKPKTEGAAPAVDKPAEGAAAGAEGAAPAGDKPAEGAAPAGDKPAEGAAAGAEAGKPDGKPDGKTEDK